MARGLALFGGVTPGRWLLVLVCLLLAAPTHAQSVDPAKLVDDFNTRALATIAAAELLAIIWLSKKLLDTLEKSHAQTLETHANVVKLGLQTTDAVKVLGEAVELVTRKDTP